MAQSTTHGGGMDQGRVNLQWARSLVEGLWAGGVERVVVSPGSRSTPLVLALAMRTGMQVHVQQDERCAAFLALGAVKAGHRPVAVVATSGSAPAHWYPAVVEADMEQQPLILLSADRPADLQDCGANQTVDQSQLFGSRVRSYYGLPEADASEAGLAYGQDLARRAVDRARWPWPGPVHINVPLREPLVPDPLPAFAPNAGQSLPVHYPVLAPDTTALDALAHRLSGQQGILVCGRASYPAGFPSAVTRLAERLDWPILADPLSNLRFGAHDRTRVLARYDGFLRSPALRRRLRPTQVLRFGGLPTSKTLQGLLGEAGLTTLVTPQGPWPDPDHGRAEVVHADPEQVCADLLRIDVRRASGDWMEAFRSAEGRCGEALEDVSRRPVEFDVLRAVSQACPDGTRVFCGNSMVIRDVDGFVNGGPTRIELFGNRGASGIDGNVSTAAGVASVSEGPVVGLLGDLALYHDMNGLLALRGLPVTLVVFNNGGGGIFEYLPQADLSGFQDYWLTPTGLDLGKVANLFGLAYHPVTDVPAFREAFQGTLVTGGAHLIEVKIDRSQSVRRHRAYWAYLSTLP